MSSISLFLLLICAVAGFFLWKTMAKNKGKASDAGAGSNSADSLRIENVRPGGVLHLRNIGPDMEEFDVQVIAKHTYRQNGYKWYELECDRGTEKLWLEMEQDDELELSVGLQKLKLSDIGLKAEDLDRIKKADEGSFTFQGAAFEFEEAGRAVFYRNSIDQDTEKFSFWDFESEDTDNCIGIERWSDGSHTVTISQPVLPSQVTVFSVA